MRRNRFRLPIGDWSADGHGRCDYFVMEVNGTMRDIVSAYRAAQKSHPDIDPGLIADDYEDTYISPEAFVKYQELGAISQKQAYVTFYLSTEQMARMVAAYVNLGDIALKAKVVQSSDADLITFETFGYGLFS